MVETWISSNAFLSNCVNLTKFFFFFYTKSPRYYPSLRKNSQVCICMELTVYHMNCGVIQGFPAPRKAVTTHVKNIVFFHLCWLSQSAAYTSLAFGSTRSGWRMNGKPFTILNTSHLSELSRIMAAKTLRNPYRWQTMRFKLS